MFTVVSVVLDCDETTDLTTQKKIVFLILTLILPTQNNHPFIYTRIPNSLILVTPNKLNSINAIQKMKHLWKN